MEVADSPRAEVTTPVEPEAPSVAAVLVPVEEGLAEAPEQPVIRPTYAESIRVQVVSQPTGKPVPRALVYSLDRDQRNEPGVLIHRKNQTLWEAFETVAVPHSAGPDGMVDVPWSGGGVQVMARVGGMWGGLDVKRDSPGEVTLQLYPNEALRVHVMDPAGASAQGLLVAIAKNGSKGTIQRATTDQHGIARFTDLGALARQFELTGKLSARLAYQGAPEVSVSIPMGEDGSLPGEPVKLKAPVWGSIQVKLEGGTTLNNAFQIDSADQERPLRCLVPFDKNGEATLGVVGLDHSFRIQWAQDGDGHRMMFDGPTMPGEVISLTLRPENRDPERLIAPKATILVLDGDRAPLRSTRLRTWETIGGSRSGGGHVKTDGDGRLLMPLGIRNDVASPLTRIELHLVENGTTATGLIEIKPVPVGERFDAGEVVVRANAPAVSGRVKGPDGRPLRGAVVTLQEYESDGDEDVYGPNAGWWAKPAGGVARTDADGRFEISAAVKSQRLRIRASARGMLGVYQTVYPKQSNATLRLGYPVSAELSATARNPVSFERLSLALVGIDPPVTWWAKIGPTKGETATLRWPEILAGKYELRLSHSHLGSSATDPNINLGRVTVNGDGEFTQGPKVIDLTQYFEERTLTVVGAQGEPLKGHPVLIQDEGNPNHMTERETDAKGRLLLVSRLGTSLVVTCGEHGPGAQWFALEGDRTVTAPTPK